MLRTTLDKAYLKRTIRPLYGWSQATPVHTYLDPNWDRSVNIWPGMAMKFSTSGSHAADGEQVTLVAASGDFCYGLSALYIGGDGIDEVADQGVNSMALWVMGPDAQFEVLAPAFDTALSWTTASGPVLISAYTSAAGTSLQGKLAIAGTSNTLTAPLARLIRVESTSKLLIGGLQGTV